VLVGLQEEVLVVTEQ
jgi:hypothetical protein